MKKIFLIILLLSIFKLSYALELETTSESAILMESSTGKVLYEKDSEKKLAPASMTKIMSMILITDAINNKSIKLSDEVLISENASSMGGSQVYLNTGEKYKVEELLKSIAVASANDAVVAMAEKISGTTELFVEKMNDKCKEIGCTNTNFKNPHGLDEEGHYSSSKDMALMAKYLIDNYKDILKYSSIYDDYLKRPDGSSTWLVNTNKLVKFYEDVDGLKTGFTKNAGYCLTATAKKNNMRLISVVMNEESSDNRTKDTVKLLNYGFNTYKLNIIYNKGKKIDKVKVNKGKKEYVNVYLKDDVSYLINNNENIKYDVKIKINKIEAPIKNNDIVGYINIIDDSGKSVNKFPLIVKEDILKANIFDYFKNNINIAVGGKQ